MKKTKTKIKIYKVPVPREIFDADISFCNRIMGRDIMGAWMDSIINIVKQK